MTSLFAKLILNGLAILSGIAALFLLSGCTSSTTIEYIEVPPEDAVHTSIESQSNTPSLPDWISHPPESSNSHYYFVVSATQQELGGVDAQKRTALLKAQASYSKQIQSVIKSEQQLEANQIDMRSDTEFKESIIETSLNTTKLHGLSIVKEWIEPNSKELFLLMQAPL